MSALAPRDRLQPMHELVVEQERSLLSVTEQVGHLLTKFT
jgi:hypothetical protein